MRLEVKLWKVEDDRLAAVESARLDFEDRLEDWLCQDIGLLSHDLLVIGRQIHQYGGVLDLLAVDRKGNLVVIELKRDKTPRDVVAQALDYASWVKRLDGEDVKKLAFKHLGKPFAEAFQSAFGCEPPEVVNETQRMYIVASSLDASTQRIIKYLADAQVDINAATFSYFNIDRSEFVARSMLLDDEDVTRRRHRGSRRLATKKLSARVEEGRLLVEFPEYDQKTSWELPEPSDRDAIKQIRDAAATFAHDNGATDGQVNAVKKALTENGYYVSG